ncbi:MAG: hypothetical protein AAFV33_13785 [Chloroflexota bacterium]
MIKRLLGGSGVILGAIGIVLSASGIVATWWASGVVTTQVQQVFDAVEQALVLSEEAATRFAVFIDDTQARLDIIDEEAPVATTLAAELADEIAAIRQLAMTADQVLTTFEPILSQFTRTDQLAMTLREALDALNATEGAVQELQAGRTEAIETLDAELETLTVRVTALQSAVAEAQDDVAVLNRRVLRWIVLVAVAVTVIFVWFGAAQYTLIRSSWRLAHPAKRAAVASD